MLDRARILSLIPHAGASCLLDAVQDWSDNAIRCSTEAHLDPANPLRRAGRLAAICGPEFGLQAAALHGALRGGGVRQRPGYLAALRAVALSVERLDDPRHGTLSVTATLERADASGLIYGFALEAECGRMLVQGRGVVMLRPAEEGCMR